MASSKRGAPKKDQILSSNRHWIFVGKNQAGAAN
jgi:hypothetical protein